MKKRHLYQYCHTQKKVVPIEEVVREKRAIDYFIQDEMAPTRNPLNPREIYTSKSKLRQAYKDAGVIEVGDAYDRGYNPEKNIEKAEKALVNKLMDSVRHRLNK